MDYTQRLKKVGLDAEVCDLLLDEVQTGKSALVVKDPRGGGQGFAIRNEDFPLLEKAAAVVVAFVGGPVAVWAPVAVAGLVILGYHFLKKSIVLDALQLAVLGELKGSPGVEPRELAGLLALPDVEEDKVKAVLDQLTAIRRADGAMVSLVAKDREDRWWAQDV